MTAHSVRKVLFHYVTSSITHLCHCGTECLFQYKSDAMKEKVRKTNQKPSTSGFRYVWLFLRMLKLLLVQLMVCSPVRYQKRLGGRGEKNVRI